MNFFSHKKILVTGGTGMLGSAIIHALVNQMQVAPAMIRVFYLANSPTQSLKDIPGIDFFAGNILNEDEVRDACKDVQLVFHTVALTTFDPRQKRLQWLVNVQGTKNLLEACRHSKTVEKICYTSTVNVLAIPNPVGSTGNFDNSNPYTNSPRLHAFQSADEISRFTEIAVATNPAPWQNRIGIGYHNSKLAAQELVNKYVLNEGMNIVSILPGTMFGPYDYLVGTGMYVLSLYQNKMPAVVGGGLPLAHVMDVAEGQLLAMEKARAGTQYILSGFEADNRTFKEMAAIITAVLREKFPGRKIKIPTLVTPRWLGTVGAVFSEAYARLFNKPMLLSRDAIRAGGYPYYYTSHNARRDLGYEPKRSFRTAVGDMIDYYKREGLMQTQTRYIDKR
jgi:dihydroflavonol-4-reductase